MKIARMIFNLFRENTFILWDEDGKEAAIVDPGMECEEDVDKVKRFLQENDLTLKMILLTHQHVDHVLGVGWLTDEFACKVYGHADDIPWGERLSLQADMFSLPYPVKPFTLTDMVKDGDVIQLNNEEIHVLHTPGHSKGGVVYYLPESGFALVGDTIFEGSIGRTDLSGGDFQTLIEKIQTKVLTLPSETVLHPGHGASTSVEDERDCNPFLRNYKK